MAYERWLSYYEDNPKRQALLDAAIDWSGTSTLDQKARAAIAHSLQRFELGESGDGERLLAKAEAAGDPTYLAAIRLFIMEEQKHSALFLRALHYLGYPPLSAHWSDSAFVWLRRALGLRMELMLFLTAEAIALVYFVALQSAPDSVLQGVAARVLADEKEHVRFQIHRLGEGFAETPWLGRVGIRMAWWLIALGTATVVALDHGAALRVYGMPRRVFFRSALRSFADAVTAVLDRRGDGVTGPWANT